MANLGFNLLINGASGKLNKNDNTVLRQKKYRNEDGAVTGLAKPEGLCCALSARLQEETAKRRGTAKCTYLQTGQYAYYTHP